MTNQLIDRWHTVLGINPEPWAVGTTFAARRGNGIRSGLSPNTKLVAYQNAFKEALVALDLEPIINESVRLTLKMLFVRQVDSYKDSGGKTKTGNYADATNLGKGTEDAMQGILFPNDRQMAWTWPVIVEQGLSSEPLIAFTIEIYNQGETDRDLVEHLRWKQRITDEAVMQGDGPSW